MVVGVGADATHGAMDAAARLCRVAKDGSVEVGERTAAIARRAPSSPFVGRQRELDVLYASFRRAAVTGRPQLATVLGDAGVGKSRLVGELRHRLGREAPPPLRRSGRCVPYGRGTAYLPLAPVLREQLELQETDPSEAVRARLGERGVLALTLGIDVAGELSPLAVREALHSAWVAFLSEVASARPLALLVEDLHWAQDGLLDLLERLLEEVDAPLAVVATARPELLERRPSWGRLANAETAWLEPLAPADAAAMLDSLTGDLAADVRELLLERAEGNPFFLEELLAGLVERGPDELEQPIPDSVQAVLAARIDLLSPGDKAAVQAASVIGRSFWAGAVREMLGSEPDVGVLEARDFVRHAPATAFADEREFVFKHALTRDVAYGSLANEQRARLHGAFAAWLERAGGGRDEDAASLAHHYTEAVASGVCEKAVQWLRRAGELATARYELDDAVALFQRALDLEQDPRKRVELSHACGRASALNYDAETFLAAMEDAIEGCRDRAMRAELCAELAFEAYMRGGMWTRPVTELVTARIEEALDLAGPDTRARAMALVASAYLHIGDGAPTASEAYAIAERLGDPMLRSVALDAQQRVAMDAREYEEAWKLNRQRLALMDEVGDADLRADTLQAAIPACIATCRFDEAREMARGTDEAASTLTPHHRVHGVAARVEVEELLGGWDAIRALEERGVRWSPPTTRRPAPAMRARCSSVRSRTPTSGTSRERASSRRARNCSACGGATRSTPRGFGSRCSAATARGRRSCSPSWWERVAGTRAASIRASRRW